jgi:peroxiredoxin family protein
MMPVERSLEVNEAALRAWLEPLIEARVAARVDALKAELLGAAERRQDVPPSTALGEHASILVFSGDLDRLLSAFIIANGAVAMGLDVSMYFTFWGLTALKKERRFTGKGAAQRLLTAMLPRDAAHAGPSRFNFLGLGRRMLQGMMRANRVESLPDLVSLAREQGVRLIACQMSMGVMGISREELIDGLEFGGAVTYLGDAARSKVTLFI